MPTYSAVREAISSTLGGISGLRSTSSPATTVNTPMAVVLPAGGVIASYNQTTDGNVTYYVRVVLLVAESNNKAGTNLADKYIAPDGAYSVAAAIDADPTLGDVVEYALVTSAGDYSILEWAGIPYLAVHFEIEVGT